MYAHRKYSILIGLVVVLIMCICNLGFNIDVYGAENKVLNDPADGQTESEDILDDTESELDALGFDTSEMPEDYDPDSGNNPNGAEYKTIQALNELLLIDPSNPNYKRVVLYGNNNDLDDNYSTFWSAENEKSGFSHRNVPSSYAASIGASGCFKGNGRKSDMAYVSMKSHGDGTFKLILAVYDEQSDIASADIPIQDNIKPANCRYVQSLTDISTGDYDGDGRDEIAVFVPNSRVAIYKMISDEGDWKEVWSYALPKIQDGDWNCVDIASGEITGDGVDDMIISWGRVQVSSPTSSNLQGNGSEQSRSVLLWGDRTGKMLRKSQQISYENNDLCRVSFVIDDLNGDDNNEVILGGQKLSDAVTDNTTRFLGYYNFDDGVLAPASLKNIKVVDGKNEDGTWNSANGFDDEYLSLPGMKADIALAEAYGKAENKCIYLDSVLYKFDDDFSIVDELDEKSSNGPLNTAGPYIEWNAAGGYFAGSTTQGITIERCTMNDTKYSCGLIYGEKNKDSAKPVLKYHNFVTRDVSERNSQYGIYSDGNMFLLIDTDKDSAVMRYTGNQTFTYSEPKVYAVLVSAPYFKDVAENAENGGDIKAFSGTSWGKSKGSGDIDGTEFSNNLGVHYEHTGVFLGTVNEGGWYFSRSDTTTNTTEFTMTYNTVAGEDCVVFYSIPSAVYEYEIEYLGEDDNGNPKAKTTYDYISIPYQPVSQTIPLKTYNKIQQANTTLPVIDGKVVKSKCGDPSSYPSSTNGLRKATVYDGDWSAPSFSEGGTVSQEISFTKDTNKPRVNGFFTNHVFAGGSQFNKAGITESFTVSDVSGTTSSSGTSASGTVYNMVPDSEGYGYYFSWKLLTYEYQAENGDTFPVVTYLTRDVTSPPSLPINFRQDHDNTTDSQIALTWTYDDPSVKSFDIYRHNEFTEGSNDVLVKSVPADSYTLKRNKNHELIYDENGKTIKVYSCIDKGLSPYSEYEYRLQVNREKVPPKSIPTKVLKCKTRALYHPEINLSDTDLTVYYDTIKTVKADIKESDSFVVQNKSFQWQKYDEKDDKWDDINLATGNSLKFSKCSLDNAGEYRCRVNSEISVLGITFRITSYSETLNVNFSKRDVKFGEIVCEENKEITRFILPVTNCSDGARTQPQGTVEFTLDNGQETQTQEVLIDGTTNEAVIEYKDLPAGAYELSSRYTGDSKVFRKADNDQTFTYMKSVDSTLWISMKNKYRFNEHLMDTLKLYELHASGPFGAEKTDVTKSISRIRLVDTKNKKTYADYDLTNDTNARIPCYFQKDKPETISRDDLNIEIYVNGEETPAISHDFTLDNGKCTLYVDDIEGDAGSPSINITRKDSILIKNADGYKDGDNPFRNPSESAPGTEAFTDPEAFNIGVYTPSGDFLGFTEPAKGADPEDYLDVRTLSPGEYIIKPSFGEKTTDLAEDDFFDITYEESSMILLGDTYTISAEGETVNGRKVGSVNLISPDKIEEVINLKYQGGTTLTFKAYPATNYAVMNWVVTEKNTGKSTVIASTKDTFSYTARGKERDILIKAVFTLKENRIKVETLGGGNESNVKCTSDELGDNPIISEGKELDFTANAGKGYEFVEWRYVTVDGKTIIRSGRISDDNMSSTTRFTMGSTSATVYAVFQKQKTKIELPDHIKAYYLNSVEYNAYLAEGTEVLVGRDMMIPSGATVILRPEDGYNVSGQWSVTAADKDLEFNKTEGGKSITFNMPESADTVKVSAELAVGEYSANIHGDNCRIDVRVNDKDDVDCETITGGSTLELTAKPDRGYSFKCWKINNRIIDNANEVYATTVNRNMDIEAVCQKVDKYEINVECRGGGNINCLIRNAYGTVDVINCRSGESKAIECYHGETMTITSSSDTNQMPSYLIVDDKRQEFTGSEYVISDFNSVKSIIVGFDPAIYHKLHIENSTVCNIKTSEGTVITDTLSLGAGEKCTLYINGISNITDLKVSLDEIPLDLKKEGSSVYSVTFENPDHDSVLRIENYKTFKIYTSEDFMNFRNSLKNKDTNANGILMNDIEAVPEMFTGYSTVLYGTLDGNGHSIYSSGAIGDGVEGGALFFAIESSGVLKNITFKNIKLNYSTSYFYYGMLAYRNSGLIENCAFANIDNSIYFDGHGGFSVAGFTGYNSGIIRNSIIKNMNIDTFGYSDDGSAFALHGNGGELINCYDDHFTLSDGKYTNGIMVYEGGTIENCYYDLGGTDYGNTERNGRNAYRNGALMKGGELAILLNNGSEAWGSWDDDDAFPVPIASGLCPENRKASVPVRIEFKFNGTRNTVYAYEGNVDMPEIHGVEAWTDGTTCYGAGAKNIPVHSDTIFTGVTDIDSDYGCEVTYNGNKQYFSDFKDAVKFADNNSGTVITVTADKSLDSSVKISKNLNIVIKGNIKFELNEKGSLDNDGTVTLSDGAKIINYGCFQNNSDGQLRLETGTSFINNGDFDNSGVIDDKSLIQCGSHMWGEAEIINEPTVTELGHSKFTCKLCGKTKTKVIDRIPEKVEMKLDNSKVTLSKGVSKIIEVKIDPENFIGNISWEYDDTNIINIEPVSGTRGTKATITALGDGKAEFTAVYSNDYGVETSVSGTCTVKSVIPVENIYFNSDKYAILSGGSRSLSVNVTPENYSEELMWSSENADIATVDEKGVLTGVNPGETVITVSSEGAAGTTVSASIAISVIDENELLDEFTRLTSDLKNAIEELKAVEGSVDELETAVNGIISEVESLSEREALTEEAAQEMRKEQDKVLNDINALEEAVKKLSQKEIRNISFRSDELVYSGSVNIPEYTVFGTDGKLLEENKDYTAELPESINSGVYSITINGMGDYSGTINGEYTIIPAQIKDTNDISLSSVKYVYNGKSRKPVVKVSGLVSDSDFTVSYKNNVEVGKASAVISGKGNYCGNVNKTFKIVPKKSSIYSLTSKKGSLKIRIRNTVSYKGASYHQIAYKKQGAAKWRYVSTRYQNKTLTKLSKGKKYYVRVRAYKSVNGTRYYGAWSTKKLSGKIR